jgi:hypothetical protein
VEDESGLALLLGVTDEPRWRQAAGIRGTAQTLARVRRRLREMERGGEVRRPAAGTRDSRGMHGRAHVRRFAGDEPDDGGGAI